MNESSIMNKSINSLPQIAQITYKILINHKGRENGLPDQQLMDQLRSFPQYKNIVMRDRRLVIERLRKEGVRICNMQDGHGWFIAVSDQEYFEFRALYGKRAFEMIKTIKAMDRQKRDESTEVITGIQQMPVQKRLF